MELSVSDGLDAFSSDRVNLTVQARDEQGATYYEWRQVSGHPVTLHNENTSSSHFFAHEVSCEGPERLVFVVDAINEWSWRGAESVSVWVSGKDCN